MRASSIGKDPAAKRLSLSFLVALSALAFISVNIFLPCMPALVVEFRTDVATVLAALTIYLAGLGIGQMIYGPLSDRHGRKPLLIIGIAIFVLGTLVCGFATDIGTFLAGRFLQALGGAAGASLGRAMIRDVHGREASASTYGYMVMATTVANGLAPVVGGMIDQSLGWRAVFHLLAGFAVLLLGFCIFALPETLRRDADRNQKTEQGSFLALMTLPIFLANALFASFMFGSWYAFVAGAPIVMVNAWGASSTGFGLWWTLGSVCYVVGNYLAGRYSQKLGLETMVRIGSIFIAAGAAILVLCAYIDLRHPLAIFGPMGVLLIGFGISQPSAVAGAVDADPKRIGAASALLGSMQIALAMAGITAVGLMPQDSAMSFALVCSGACAAAIAGYGFCRRHIA